MVKNWHLAPFENEDLIYFGIGIPIIKIWPLQGLIILMGIYEFIIYPFHKSHK